MNGETATVDWFKLGRDHLWLGRPIDAVLCLRRAISAQPRQPDARFHLGEALWKLDLREAARATWRDSAKAHPAHLASWLALAEAALNAGDVAEARNAAAEVLRRAPDEPRAKTFRRVADAMSGAAGADWDAIADAVRADPTMIAAPARARLIAEALVRTTPSSGREQFVTALAAMPAALPLELLAVVAESAVAAAAPPALAAALPAIFEQALARDPMAALDSLRRIALVARSVGDARLAGEFAARYATGVVAADAPAVPLLWPARTAGAALRVAVLVAPSMSASARAALAALAAEGIELTLVAAVAPDALDAFCSAIPVRPRARIAVGDAPGSAAARALVDRDPDVFVDACGLDVASGPLLAHRPGRAVWTLADHRPPLVDERIVPEVGALAAACAGVARVAACVETPVVLGQLWTTGLRAHQQQDAARARAAYDALLGLQPGFAPALHFRARVAWDGGDLDAAAVDLAAAIAAAPAYADARVDASRLALERDLPQLARDIAAGGLALAPAHAGLHRAIGHAELRLGAGLAAAESFERAMVGDPLDAETHYNVGVALQLDGNTDAAARAYQRAITLDPALVDADFNLGVLFQQQRRLPAAIEAYRRVVARDPTRDGAWKNLGETLRATGRIDEWVANFRRFEAACPESLLMAVQALEVCQHRAEFARLDRVLDGLRQERYRAASESALVDALEELLYLLLFFDIEPSVIHRFARTYDQSIRRVYGVPRPRPAARRPGRLRVGYLSADLRDHVMGRMMWQALRHHDRERFDVYCYSLSADRDDWTARFEALATGFRDVSALVDREAARLIGEDDLDLLVDLQTHTKGARPGILALKPARVQITHVASAGTLGMSTIDFKLTDRYADVPEAQEHQIERLLAMEGCVYPFRAPDPADVPALARDAVRIPADAFVIGAFVTPMKLSRRCLTLWKEVADRLPRARFAFSPLNDRDRGAYLRLTAAVGIGADRLVFLPQGRDEAHNQARYRVVDVVLDPMPFGNVNGTIEPLAMGVPVVTLVGRRHGERTSSSILENLGVTSTLAQSGREYVDLAVRLAEDPAFAREVRDAIARGLAGSPLVDGAGHTRNLEAAYVAAIGEIAPAALESAGTGRTPAS